MTKTVTDPHNVNRTVSATHNPNLTIGATLRMLVAAFASVMLMITSAIAGAPAQYVRHDPSFNGTGSLVEPFLAGTNNVTTALAIQPDGKIVVARTGVKVVRYNPDGTSDASFGGGDGKIDLSAETSLDPVAIAFQSDGKIVIGGDPTGQTATAKLIRLNADGTLDTSFGTQGVATWSLSTVSSIVIQPDGKILSASQGSTGANRGVSRHNPNGTLDNSWAGDGSWNPTNKGIEGLALQSDGKVLAVGGPGFSIFRLESNGVPETTFGTSGEVIVPGWRSGFDVAIQADGKIVAAGYLLDPLNGISRIGVARLQANGNFDAGFGNGGLSWARIPYSSGENGRRIMVLPDGKLLLGGLSVFMDAVMQRYNSDGTFDTTFDFDGRAFVNVLGGVEQEVALDAQGRMVAAATFNGSTQFAIGRSVAVAAGPRTLFDEDGDGRADLAVWRPSTGTWYTQTANNFLTTPIGLPTDKIVPADYDGDGKSDPAVWNPSTGEWKVLQSESYSFFSKAWGQNGDQPVPSDLMGDSQHILFIYRPSTTRWWAWKHPDEFSILFGSATSVPVRGDFDGDRISDPTVYSHSDHVWRTYRSSGGTFELTWGEDGDVPVPADYDADGTTDIAVWRPSTGKWWIIGSTAGWITHWTWGEPGDKPVPADYDGDGRADVAVWRPSNGTWYIANSSDFSIRIRQFGEAGDIPIPSAFIY